MMKILPAVSSLLDERVLRKPFLAVVAFFTVRWESLIWDLAGVWEGSFPKSRWWGHVSPGCRGHSQILNDAPQCGREGIVIGHTLLIPPPSFYPGPQLRVAEDLRHPN